MKIRLAVMLAALAPAIAVAHDVTPGTWQVSASTSLGYTRQSSDAAGSSSTLWLDTEGLYHVAKNLGIGVGVSARWSSYDIFALSGPAGVRIHDSTTTLQIGPALAWRIPVSERLSLLAQAGFRYTRSDSSYGGLSVNGYAAALGAGVSWFVAERVSFDATLAYQRSHIGPNVIPADSNTFAALVGVSIFLGGA